MPAKKPHPKPSVGSKYEKTFKGKNYTLEVVKNVGGIAYKLKGSEYSSPSAAAKSVTNGEVNGWRFWGID